MEIQNQDKPFAAIQIILAANSKIIIKGNKPNTLYWDNKIWKSRGDAVYYKCMHCKQRITFDFKRNRFWMKIDQPPHNDICTNENYKKILIHKIIENAMVRETTRRSNSRCIKNRMKNKVISQHEKQVKIQTKIKNKLEKKYKLTEITEEVWVDNIDDDEKVMCVCVNKEKTQ